MRTLTAARGALVVPGELEPLVTSRTPLRIELRVRKRRAGAGWLAAVGVFVASCAVFAAVVPFSHPTPGDAWIRWAVVAFTAALALWLLREGAPVRDLRVALTFGDDVLELVENGRRQELHRAFARLPRVIKETGRRSPYGWPPMLAVDAEAPQPELRVGRNLGLDLAFLNALARLIEEWLRDGAVDPAPGDG